MATGVSGTLPSFFQYNAYVQPSNGMYVSPHFVEEYNVEGNYSTIKIDYINYTSSMYEQWVGWDISGKVNIAGKEYSWSGYVETANYTATKWPCSIVSDPIYHNADGTKTISITTSYLWTSSGQVGMRWDNTGTLATKSVALTTIPRASLISASNADIGSNTTIALTRYATSFTHTITYEFGGLTGTIATKTSSTSISWTVPTSFYAKIPNAKYGTCNLTCNTYSGSTLIGTKTTTFRATANENLCKPTLNATYQDTNTTTVGLTGNNQKLVKYFSNVQCATGAQARNSATLVSQSITCGSSVVNASTATFNNIEVNKFVYTATDSRGYSTSITLTPTMVSYIKLTCNLDAENPTASGNTTMKLSGNCFKGSFGSVSNTITLQYRIKENNGAWGAYQTVSATVSSAHTYEVSVNLTGLNYQSTYTLEAKVVDKLMTITSNQKRIRCIPVFDWGENNFRVNGDLIVAGTITSNVGNEISLINTASIPATLSLDGGTQTINPYPVGSIYMCVIPLSPADYFGGEWVEYTEKPSGFNVYLYQRIS